MRRRSVHASECDTLGNDEHVMQNDRRRLPGIVDNRRPSGGCGKRPYVPVPYHERKALQEKMLRVHR